MADTGYSHADAEDDFQKARRRQILGRIAVLLRGMPGHASHLLRFDEVVEALGQTGQRDVGLQTVPLRAIVGTVGRGRDFDRWFNPRTQVSRQRWIQMATAKRLGEGFPPVDLYRVGSLYFARDGHHRISVAVALRLGTIEAAVCEVSTRVDAAGIRHRGDLLAKRERQVFLDRVPMPRPALGTISITHTGGYTELSEAVEAWGCRLMQREARYLDLRTIAQRWYAEEYEPVVDRIRAAHLVDGVTDADAYLWLNARRYQLPRSARWPDDLIEHLSR